MTPRAKPILVIGGGIAGMTAAVEAAEVGHDVVLVEKEPFLGGRVVRSHRYFPKMCPPTCGYEINVRRIRQNPRITVHTMATVQEVTGHPGNYRVKIRIRPRYVTGDHPLDEALIAGLTGECPDDFNLGMGTTKALYLPHPVAYPPVHVLDREALTHADRRSLAPAVASGAIDLDMDAQQLSIRVGSIVLATGWRPYDVTRLDNLGGGKFPNVITNVMMERLAAREGPTGGRILRPSDGEPPRNVAFVQCAGSRDENHLPYCSAVCCMASLKQARYLREQDPEARATVFYIDIRTSGRLEKFYYDLLEDEMISFVKGKVATIAEEAGSGNLVLDVEDTLTRELQHPPFDLVVLATGVVPNTEELDLPGDFVHDEYGFAVGPAAAEGIFPAGCVKRPCDVARTTKDATAAALKAIQGLTGGD